MTKQSDWISLYKEIARNLNSFYLIHKNNSGKVFYAQCMQHEQEFHKLFGFVKKLSNDGYEKSLDPVHIFASFNYFKISEKKRKEKIKFYYKVLGLDSTHIDNLYLDLFPSFPHPNITKIVSARVDKYQKQVWQFFHALMINDQKQVELLFNSTNKWYGINLPTLTMFMFWVDSDSYIPLDANTETLLIDHQVLKARPKNYQDYIQLNNRSHSFSKNICRSLAHYALRNNNMEHLSYVDTQEVLLFLSSAPTIADLENKFYGEVAKSRSQSTQQERQERLQNAPTKPTKSQTSISVYNRNPDVVVEVLQRANGICEECKQNAPFLRAKDGSPYLEVHHCIPLAEGGEDTIENAQALCPNCHRKKHFGIL